MTHARRFLSTAGHSRRPHLRVYAQGHERGFTLLELVVAIGIFALMAAMAYGGLSAVLNTRASVQRAAARTSLYQKVYLRLRDDFQNAANRSIRDETNQLRPSLYYDSYRQRIEFSRGGWPNPLGLPRTGFERVAYSVNDKGQLIRESWNVLDRAPRSEPDELIVLDHVEKFALRFLDYKRQWNEKWPPDSTTQVVDTTGTGSEPDMPLAVEIRLSTRDWADLRFLFQTTPNIGLQTQQNSSTANGATTTGTTAGTTN